VKRHLFLLFAVGTIIFLNIAVWTAVLRNSKPELRVSFLDVGQGDAILIEGPTGRQILIDGGKDRSVVRELPKRMGPIDRTLDLIVETHPDADHIGGLPSVLSRYRIGGFMTSDISSDSSYAAALAHATEQEEGLQSLEARRGQRLHLGGGAYADILYPDRDVPNIETNTGSVVMRIVYGSTSFLLTGDAPSSIEDWLVRLDATTLKSTVVKAGHHGSRTSTGKTWLEYTDPDTVVISAGKNNSYGHPHDEVVANITAHGAILLSTADEGTITFVSNGEEVHVR
jgi:competence protein ComEC